MGLHEQLIKERFLRFAFQHPRYMLELMLLVQTEAASEELVSAFGKYDWTVWGVLCPVAFLVIAVMACWRLEILSRRTQALRPCLAATGLMSLAAPIWTYPIYHVLGETFLVWIALCLGLAALLLARRSPNLLHACAQGLRSGPTSRQQSSHVVPAMGPLHTLLTVSGWFYADGLDIVLTSLWGRSMQAVILAGGAGTRLSEETTFRPKPLVEVADAILWHIMKIYAAHGIGLHCLPRLQRDT